LDISATKAAKTSIFIKESGRFFRGNWPSELSAASSLTYFTTTRRRTPAGQPDSQIRTVSQIAFKSFIVVSVIPK
jgi:hypothetical protein